MGLANFGQLKTSIADLLNRSDLTAKIPDFVTMLEARVNREVKFRNRRMETSTALAFSGTDEAVMPTDYLEARTFVWQSTPRVRLEFMSPAAFEATYTTDTPATPQHYTIFGSTFQIGPFPNSDVGATLRYYQRLTSLSADSDTNWLLTYHPDVYLYGSALESAPYLGEDGRIQVWLGFFDRAAAELQGEDARARWSGAPIRPTLDITIV
jgi:hypothetical protein